MSGAAARCPYTEGMARGKIAGTANLLRAAGRTARQASRQLDSGNAGSWKVELGFSGIADERRLELANALNALTGNETPKDYPSDGILRCSAICPPGFSLAVACGQTVSKFYSLLQEAGLKAEEILDSTVTLEMDALTPQGAAPVAAGRLGKLSYGLNVAAASMFDQDAMQHNGERTYEIHGLISGCEGAETSLQEAMREMGQPEAEITDGCLFLDITTDKVGSGLGALLLCTRKLDHLLETAPASASLTLQAEAA